MDASTAQPSDRLARLLAFLDQDPRNPALLADAAAAALDEGEAGQASDLIDRLAAVSPLGPQGLNLKGLAAIGERRFGDATVIFEGLLADAGDDPGLRFNLAWCKAMQHDHEAAAALLDDRTVAAVPRAAALKVQSLHHLGRLEEALACGLGYVEARPGDEPLMAALALAALDAGELDLAAAYAARAGQDNSDAAATLGMIRLNADEVEGALELFDRALADNPRNARALLGRGLGQMAKGDAGAAAGALTEAASAFGDHLGSWVAAGWAHFIGGDHVRARGVFERALALDDTFAETHGSLAVLDMAEGDSESARRRTDVALRLDRDCFSAALARSLLLQAEGKPAAADRIRDAALNTPVIPGGRTIAQAMAALGSKRG